MRDDELADLATEWLATARAAWPQIAIDEAEFVQRIVARLPEHASCDLARSLHAGDLWLTAACAAGDPAALAAFEQQYMSSLDHVLASSGIAADLVDEVKQEVRRKLLVADDGAPRIADYSGRAELRIWLRTAAIRTSIDLIRKQRDVPVADEELAALPAIADDPELAHLKARYRDELRGAIVEALKTLTARERLLLKYHYVDGLGIDRLGQIFGVHRTSTARWLRLAREALADEVHRMLIAQLGVGSTELRSIARLVESQLDISVRRLLDGEAAAP